MTPLSLNFEISRPVRLVALVGAAAILVLGLILPAVEAGRERDRAIEAARADYVDTAGLLREYAELKKLAGTRESARLKEKLFTYVNRVADRLGLEKRIDYVRPDNRTDENGKAEELVYVSFKGITLSEFVGFLYHIEVQKNEIFIRDISIRKDEERNLNMQMALQKRS